MMRIALQVVYTDGRERSVTVTAPDTIAFERTYDKPVGAIASGRMEYLWWLAWHVERRTDGTDLDFDPWVETVDAVTDAETLDDPAPLGLTANTGD